MKRGPSKPTCPTCGFKAQDARGLSAHMRNAKHGKYELRAQQPLEPSTPEHYLAKATEALQLRKVELEKGIHERAKMETELERLIFTLDKLQELQHPAPEAQIPRVKTA